MVVVQAIRPEDDRADGPGPTTKGTTLKPRDPDDPGRLGRGSSTSRAFRSFAGRYGIESDEAAAAFRRQEAAFGRLFRSFGNLVWLRMRQAQYAFGPGAGDGELELLRALVAYLNPADGGRVDELLEEYLEALEPAGPEPEWDDPQCEGG
jgi:hypothetical protein